MGSTIPILWKEYKLHILQKDKPKKKESWRTLI